MEGLRLCLPAWTLITAAAMAKRVTVKRMVMSLIMMKAWIGIDVSE
jgi:hypothetical protein